MDEKIAPVPTCAFDPSPEALYTVDQLYANFDPSRLGSYRDTYDFEIYHEFVVDGGAASTNKPMVLHRAAHDCSILQLVAEALRDRKIVAIMGGHAAGRSTQAYKDAARTAAKLTERGYLILSGGGPGAMEAAHLGAAVGRPGAELEDALVALHEAHGRTSKPILIRDMKVEIQDAAVQGITDYLAPAWEIRKAFPKGGGLAIPTWMYGWEPTSVFAGQVAKYFQNSIREDGLLAAAADGIVFVEGRAGTLQEVFQDAAQNYYKSFPAPSEQDGRGRFSPMVFLGDFWTVEHDPARVTFPVKALLDNLWAAGSDRGEAAADRVHFVLTPDEAVDRILDAAAEMADTLAVTVANTTKT